MPTNQYTAPYDAGGEPTKDDEAKGDGSKDDQAHAGADSGAKPTAQPSAPSTPSTPSGMKPAPESGPAPTTPNPDQSTPESPTPQNTTPTTPEPSAEPSDSTTTDDVDSEPIVSDATADAATDSVPDQTTTEPSNTDAPSPSADGFFGDSRCSDEFTFCEDFESGELDGNRWAPQGPAPDIDDGLAARGTHSAHFHTQDNGLSLIRTSEPFPMPNNSYYARAFVYFDSMPTAPPWAHWTVSGAAGSGTEAEIRIGGQYDNTINRFGVGTDGGPTGDWTNLDQDPEGAVVPVPVQQWVCLEWQYKGDTNEGFFWWDDVEHPSLYTSATEHGGDSSEDYLLPSFESAWFGWWLYQTGTDPGEFDVWIDEIVIDDQPIGCTR